MVCIWSAGDRAQSVRRMPLRALWSAGNDLLSRLPVPHAWHRPHGALFILGAPRSGTTVLTQSLVYACEVESFTNLHAAVYGAPWLIEMLLGPWPVFPPGSFMSRRGRTRGLMGAHEGARFHYRFFPHEPQAVPPGTVDLQDCLALRRNVRAMAALAKRPVVIKNVANGLRLCVLAQVLPEALFIVLRRDEDAIVRSLLAARRNESGTESAWFSVKPRGWQKVRGREPADQARWQSRAVYAAIASARSRCPGRFHDVDYRDFCSNPDAVIAGIADFACSHGCGLHLRRNAPLAHMIRRPAGVAP